jgi:hypothetical protein
MRARTLAVTAFTAAVVTLGACSGDATLLGLTSGIGSGTDTLNTAKIRFANATNASLDPASNGVVFAGNGAIDFGGSSSCTPTNATRPDLSVRLTGTQTTLPGLATAYQIGVRYTVIAYTGALGQTSFATIADTFTPVGGQSALRVFNAGAVGSSYDVYVTDAGAPLASSTPQFSNVTAGTFSAFGNANADTPRQVRITNSGSKTVLFDVGSTALIPGTSVTLVIAAPTAGSAALRVFSVAGC